MWYPSPSRIGDQRCSKPIHHNTTNMKSNESICAPIALYERLETLTEGSMRRHLLRLSRGRTRGFGGCRPSVLRAAKASNSSCIASNILNLSTCHPHLHPQSATHRRRLVLPNLIIPCQPNSYKKKKKPHFKIPITSLNTNSLQPIINNHIAENYMSHKNSQPATDKCSGKKC